VYCTTVTGSCGPYGQLTVALYNASQDTPLIACAPTPVSATVQFSFCLITGTANTGSQTAATFTSVSTGVFTTASTVYLPTASYTVGSILRGTQYTFANATPVALSLSAPSTVRSGTNQYGNYVDNSNVIGVVNGSLSASTDNFGIAMTSIDSTFAYAYSRTVYCTTVTGSCGPYGRLTVALYNASQDTPLIACAPMPVLLSSTAAGSSSSSSSSTGPTQSPLSSSSSTGAALSSGMVASSSSGLSSSSAAVSSAVSSSFSHSASSPTAAIGTTASSTGSSTTSPAPPFNFSYVFSGMNPAPFAGGPYPIFTQSSLHDNAYFPDLFYAQGRSLWQSIDAGVTWTALGTNLTLGFIPTLLGAGLAFLENGVFAIYGGVLTNGTAINTVITTASLFDDAPLVYNAPFSPRYDMAYVTVPGTNMTLFCAGLTSEVEGTNDCWISDRPELGPMSWSQQTASAPFPSLLANAAMVTLYDNTSTVILCGGAVVSGAINICWVSETLAVTWSAGVAAPWSPRSQLVMTSDLDGWAYLYGGESSSGSWYYDLWLSTDKARTWSQLFLPATTVLQIQDGCIGISYDQSFVNGVFGTHKRLIFYGGYSAALGSYVTGDYFATLSLDNFVMFVPSIPTISFSLPEVQSVCTISFNIAGTLTGFGASGINPNPALSAVYIEQLIARLLAIPASEVQVCVHVQYAYLDSQTAELFVYLPGTSVLNVSVIINGTNTTLTQQPATLPISTAASSSSSSTARRKRAAEHEEAEEAKE
jgi:hypothetical protein